MGEGVGDRIKFGRHHRPRFETDKATSRGDGGGYAGSSCFLRHRRDGGEHADPVILSRAKKPGQLNGQGSLQPRESALGGTERAARREVAPLHCGSAAAGSRSRNPKGTRRAAGHRMVTMTVRAPLRDAMAEEMRPRRRRVRPSARKSPSTIALQVPGPVAEFVAARVIDTPITEHRFCRPRRRHRDRRPQAHRRIHDFNFACRRSTRFPQLRAKRLTCRVADGLLRRVSAPNGPAAACRGPSTAGLFIVVCACAAY